MSLRRVQVWLVLVAFFGGGCGGEDGCSVPPEPALRVVVENGSYESSCVYGVQAKSQEGSWFDLDCSVVAKDCICVGGKNPLAFEVRLLGSGPNEFPALLETKWVEVEAGSCGAITSELLFARPPLESFFSESCLNALGRLSVCGVASPFAEKECLDTRPISQGEEMVAFKNSYYGCFAEAACSELIETICTGMPEEAPVSGALVICLSSALGDLGGEPEEIARALATACEG